MVRWAPKAAVFLAGAAVMTAAVLHMAGVETPGVQASVVGGQGKALIGGQFALTDHNGTPFTQDNLKGSYSLIYFGFTYCPDICPATLDEMAAAKSNLPADLQNKLKLVFVSVDPDRDSPSVLKDYIANFDPQMIGLTGPAEAVKAMAKAYLVYYAKQPAQAGKPGYQVDHSGYMYLMNPNGDYVAHFSGKQKADEIAKRLTAAMGSAS
jgi:protein SCO1